MDQDVNKFQNQPRLGAAMRQRSHSAKELTTMLQQLQLNVKLMPLNGSSNQANLASTSEEESDSMNSNEESNEEISEDEAFGDFEEEEDFNFNNRFNGNRFDRNNFDRTNFDRTNFDRTNFDGNNFDNNRFDRSSTNSNLRNKPRSKSTHLANLSNSFSTGLVYPKKLRRSNSMGSLLSYKQQMNNEFYCDDDEDYNSFKVFSNEFHRTSSNQQLNNGRNSSFRSTLPRVKHRYSTSLKDNLNNLVDETDQNYYNLYKSNQMFRLTNYLKNKFNTTSTNDQFDSKFSHKNLNKVKTDFKNDLKKDSKKYSKNQNIKSDLIKPTSTTTNESIINKSITESISKPIKQSKVKSIESDDKHNETNLSTELNAPHNCLNEQAAATNSSSSLSKNELRNVCLNDNLNQLNHPHHLNIEQQQQQGSSSDASLHSLHLVMNNHLNGAATSSNKMKPPVVGSGSFSSDASDLLTSSSSGSGFSRTAAATVDEHINNKVNSNSSASSCKSSVEYSSSNEFLNPFDQSKQQQQEQQQIEQINSEFNYKSSLIEQSNKSSDYLVNQTTTHLQIDQQTSIESFDKQQILDEQLNSTKSFRSNESIQSEISNEFKSSEPSNVSKNCELLILNDVQSNKQLKSVQRSNRIQLKSELPALIEENDQIESPASSAIKMQTLAETQYNQLSYHIAALSCVCDNNKNLTNQYSSFNSSPNQNSPSSVDSDEYSSSYNSPPSSPSSISSYSSAEEDCSILTGNNDLSNSSPNSSNSLINKPLVNGSSSQSLANLITANHNEFTSSNEAGLDVVDCATVFNNSQSNQGLLTTVNHHQLSSKETNSNDIKQLTDDHLINEKQQQLAKLNQTSSFVNTNATNRRQERVRKTSILRNHTSTDLSNYCKKEVKFADTLGFALEKVKYFPPISPQVKPKRHSVNLASLQRDYYDEHQELFILHSKPQTADSNELKKQFEENYHRIKQSKLNENILKNNHPHQPVRSGSPPHLSSNNFWDTFLTSYQTVGSSIREGYCGDMLFNQQSFENNLSVNTQLNRPSTDQLDNLNNNNSSLKTNLMNNYSSPINFKSANSNLEFNPLNFMNNQSNSYSSSLSTNQSSVSFLFLNFNSQPNIQSDFPHRLRSQSVLLHSLNISGNEIEGKISVMNLTFEKRIIVKYTLNKWVTERQCEAIYFQKDCDNSDQFKFRINLNETDFPQFQLDEDRTMMFAIRYETGDGRIYWDNNFGQDYRLKCRFN